MPLSAKAADPVETVSATTAVAIVAVAVSEACDACATSTVAVAIAVLTAACAGLTTTCSAGGGEYVYEGIAKRNFERSFSLGEYMEVTKAEMKDGMLHILIEKNVPEEKKPKTIKINKI